jgi:hypothetical protein
MTLLATVVATLGGSAPIFLSAPFSDITDASGPPATSGNTVTLTMGSGQTITYSLGGLAGTVSYKLNGGATTPLAEGGTLSVANGDTLQHLYASPGPEGGTVTLVVSGRTVGSFDCIGT